MTRKITTKGARRKLDELQREFVLKRDNNTCQWCKADLTNKKGDVSHVVPKAQGLAFRYNLNNVKLLCFRCHRIKWHAESGGRQWFDNKFPKRAKEIQKIYKRKDIIKLPRDYEIIAEFLKDQHDRY
ncbi:MAG: hypothetical protein DRP09_11050 [Candidatus Thorarchaeota archaeon]|nr:MAG: hypothetical protein DRP09_11050 [Candidatus Thorarchaeota archaeon]